MRKKINAKKNLRSVIYNLHQYTAGKSIEEIAKKYNLNPKSIFKLGSNENVLGTSLKAKKAAQLELERVNIYPEITSDTLSKRIKSLHKLKNVEVVIGNGMDHIFEMLARLFLDNGDETIICPPTFSCYELSTIWAGAKPIYVPLSKKDNQLDVPKILKSINKKTKIIFICSPNNPTGNLMKTEDIKKILDSTDKIVFLDEAYIEFSGKTLVKWIEKYPNLIIGRTFSKIYGLAGYRVGYAFIHKNLAPDYLNSITPFVVTRPSQSAALAALDDKEFVKKSIKLVKDGKKFYYKELSKLGINFYRTDSNFIAINTYPKKSKEFSLKFLEKGVIIRECSSFGKGGEYILRITIGKEEHNKKIISILKEII